MNPRSRLMIVAALLAIGAVVAVLITQRQPSQNTPSSGRTLPPNANCIKAKPAVSKPSWYPADLPMPDGSFPRELPPQASGYRRIVWDVNGTLRDFVIFALTEWKQQGWALGRGEGEPGEAEDNFVKAGRYGIFRAQSVMCDEGRTWVLLVVNDPTAKPTSTPSFNRFTSASPTPLS